MSEPVYPAPGSTIPGQPGFVVGECGHRVAGTEWRAGFCTCERCPKKTDAVPMTPEELEELRESGCDREDVEKLIAEVDRLTTPPVGSNTDHTARLRSLFVETVKAMEGASPEALAAQLALYANSAIWAAERETDRALELARIVSEHAESGAAE